MLNKTSLIFGVIWIFAANGLFNLSRALGISVAIVGTIFVWLSIFRRKKVKE